jgi:hypothetical protein
VVANLCKMSAVNLTLLIGNDVIMSVDVVRDLSVHLGVKVDNEAMSTVLRITVPSSSANSARYGMSLVLRSQRG